MGLLDGKRAIVTGGASGIGLATCRRFAEEGAAVAVLDLDGEGAEAAAKEVGGLAGTVDVGEPAALDAAFAAAAARLGGLEIVFNNAGAGHLAPLQESSPEDFERVIRTNLAGVMNGLRAAVPLLRRSGGGAIVNNASASGVRATRGEAAYSAAKAGVISLSQAAALELGPAIRVNCVSPGMIRTALSEPLFRARGLLDPVVAATPLGRTGTAEDVADVVVFLCSDRARFVTGQNLIVDGGLGLPQAGVDEALRALLARLAARRA